MLVIPVASTFLLLVKVTHAEEDNKVVGFVAIHCSKPRAGLDLLVLEVIGQTKCAIGDKG